MRIEHGVHLDKLIQADNKISEFLQLSSVFKAASVKANSRI
jgi:hypothetical protein